MIEIWRTGGRSAEERRPRRRAASTRQGRSHAGNEAKLARNWPLRRRWPVMPRCLPVPKRRPMKVAGDAIAAGAMPRVPKRIQRAQRCAERPEGGERKRFERPGQKIGRRGPIAMNAARAATARSAAAVTAARRTQSRQ